MKAIVLLLSLFTFFTHLNVEFQSTEESYIAVKGTSTLHDWKMDTKDLKVGAALSITNGLVEITSFKGSLPVKSLKSDKETMDKNAYKALKADKYSTIDFKLIEILETDASSQTVKGLFDVTISGVTNQMVIEGTASIIDDINVRITGSTQFKMSDHNVEPPSFMFGSLKTGDSITVEFDVIMAITGQSLSNGTK